MPEINPKLSNEQMKELEDEALRNATVGTQTGIKIPLKRPQVKLRSCLVKLQKRSKKLKRKKSRFSYFLLLRCIYLST